MPDVANEAPNIPVGAPPSHLRAYIDDLNRSIKMNKPIDSQNGPLEPLSSSTSSDTLDTPSTKPHILIVDDNQHNLSYLAALLSLNDYAPSKAIDGHQALEFLKTEKPDLILLDIMMPGMDGFETCRMIKSNPGTNAIPIIFLTALSETEDLVKGLNVGAVDYVVKPVNQDELLARIATHVELSQTKENLRRNNQKLKDKEEKILYLNDLLSQKVAEKSEKLELVQEKLLLNEYKSEIAEFTTGTLHNVKNMLNSVKISAELVLETGKGSEAMLAFNQANGLLKENLDDLEDFICRDPKGMKLMTYYLKIEQALREEKELLAKEFRSIGDKVDSIARMIDAQQSHRRGGIETQPVELHQIIDDTIITQQNLLETQEITLEKTYCPSVVVNIHKPKFMHVLINLLRNAQDAMAELPASERIIQIKTEIQKPFVRISVSDRGEGINQTDLPRLFLRGYTTKKTGHGYGLYSSKSYLNEMNGEITAHSEGSNKGSRFIIHLPLSATNEIG